MHHSRKPFELRGGGGNGPLEDEETARSGLCMRRQRKLSRHVSVSLRRKNISTEDPNRGCTSSLRLDRKPKQKMPSTLIHEMNMSLRLSVRRCVQRDIHRTFVVETCLFSCSVPFNSFLRFWSEERSFPSAAGVHPCPARACGDSCGVLLLRGWWRESRDVQSADRPRRRPAAVGHSPQARCSSPEEASDSERDGKTL